MYDVLKRYCRQKELRAVPETTKYQCVSLARCETLPDSNST